MGGTTVVTYLQEGFGWKQTLQNSTEFPMNWKKNVSKPTLSQWEKKGTGPGWFIKKPFGRGPTTPEIGDLPIILANYSPMPSMGLVYLPTRMVDFYGKLVGKYTVRPMDGIWFTKCKDPPSTLYPCRVPTLTPINGLENYFFRVSLTLFHSYIQVELFLSHFF